MRPQLLLSLLVLLPYTTASPFQFALTLLKHEITPTADNDTCDCTGVNPLNRTSGYICGDYRLGPNTLPSVLPALSLVTNYDRFGGKTPGEYLRLWTNASTGRYVYPPFDGFQLDSDAKPIKGKMMLGVGQEVDRFGSEKGTFFSAADAPFSQRALPPSSLNQGNNASYPNDYHVYRVIKPLEVMGGPIRSWFGQPGLGTQFFTPIPKSVEDLLNGGFFERVHKSDIVVGPGDKPKCGQ